MKNWWYKISLFSLLFIPFFVKANEDFVPLIGLPGLENGGDYNTQIYINLLYILAISIASFIAVVKLILAGVKYILTDLIDGKESAKEDIKWSIIGLLIIIGAVTILNTINPQLTNLSALDNINAINITLERRAEPHVSVSTPSNNLDTYDLSTISHERLIEIIKNCTSGENPGTWITSINGTATCQGGVSTSASNNILNTQELLEEYIGNHPEFSEEESLDFRRRFNQFVGTQEPEDLDKATIEAIKRKWGASEVIFIVTTTLVGTHETSGFTGEQEAICELLTGSDTNIVIGSNYMACVVE